MKKGSTAATTQSRNISQQKLRNRKKRAIVATARKLAVLLHHLWVSGEEPLHNGSRMTVAAAA